MKKLIFLFLFLLGTSSFLSAQQKGIDALKVDYPKLMEKFGKELEDQRADYIFAIDVSGTMGKWKDVVVPALSAFFGSLQEGDYVSIIKFGGDAVNDVGSAGRINEATIRNLNDCANHIYDKPLTDAERKRFYNWTDLDNMLHYLATDMKQVDRNRLKFVFLITDFLHDVPSERRGKEDWDGVARRFAIEQAGNDVYVFALQLPGEGSGRDLDRVRSVFPDHFHFNHVRVDNGGALSDWFTQRKNAILLNKFQALIEHKIQPADFAFTTDVDIDGNLDMYVTWKPNPVYYQLRVDGLFPDVPGYQLKPLLPKRMIEDKTIRAGKFSYHQVYFLHPCFKRMEGSLEAEASFDVPYMDELAKLGFPAPELSANAPVAGRIFCYPISFRLFILILALILLYIILVIRAFARNASDRYKINGLFKVMSNGNEVGKKVARNVRDSVEIGDGSSFLNIPGCQWAIRIYVVRFNPFFRFFKKPVCKVKMTRGRGFKIDKKYTPHIEPRISRYGSIAIEVGYNDYSDVVKWIKQ
jgi:hypothetical protein